MRNKFLTIVACFALALALVACNNPEAKSGEGTQYGVTDKCPFYVTVKCDGDGKVSEVEIREFLSVYDIGKLSSSGGKAQKYGVEIADSKDYARYVRVGNKTFEYVGDEYVCDEIPVGDKSYDSYIKTEHGAMWYIHCVKEGDFDIVDSEGKSYGVAFDEYDGYCLKKEKWADKLSNGYHEGVEYENGYKENIYNLITHIKNHGFYDYSGEEKPNKDGSFKVGKYDTLFKLENFHDYMHVAEKAYEKARNNVK